MSNVKSEVPYAVLRALVKRFDDWGKDPADFVRTSYTRAELTLKLRSVLQTRQFDDDAFDLLIAISCAIEGRHRAFRLALEYPKDGGSFQKITQLDTWALTSAMADEVDVAIAEGVKAESAIASAMERYQLSRKEVFRRLRTVRGYRALTFAACEHLQSPQREGRDCPLGYVITHDGKLARISV